MRASLHSTVAAGLLLCLAADAEAVQLRGKIERVGLPGSSQDVTASGSDFYRPGCWTPILVELTNLDGDLFQGTLTVEQFDRDGDIVVAHPATAVAVRGTRSYYIYVPGSVQQSPDGFGVKAFAEDGRLVPLQDDKAETVRVLKPPRTLAPVAPHARVILDISEVGVRQLNNLVHDKKLVRELVVTRLSATALPDQVAGLDMVDIIVWDGADPSALDPAQLDALVEWTQRGGMLVIGVSRKWELLAKSRLGDLLPAKLSGAAESMSLTDLQGSLFDLPPVLNEPLTFTPVTKQTVAPDTLYVVPESPQETSQLYITQRPCGQGTIVLSSALLQDLLAHAAVPAGFLREILATRTNPRADEDMSNKMPADIFRHVEQLTGFRLETGLYFLVAFLFVVVYILIATAGSWAWLKRRSMVAYAWPAFGVVAAVSSGLSLAAVQVIRGAGSQVQQLTVIDARAGSQSARALYYAGLKTASHTLLDVCVPQRWQDANDEMREISGGLLPLGRSIDFSDNVTYAAGQRYEAVASLGQLRSVPLRATLKQFQGRWTGELPGTLNASLRTRSASTFQLDPTSWIQNDLPVDLNDCWLFVTARTAASVKVESGSRADRSNSIYGYRIGTLLAGQRLPWRDARARNDVAEIQTVLSNLQRDWLSNLRIYQTFQGTYEESDVEKITTSTQVSAMLALTLMDELDQSSSNADFKKGRGRELDRSLALTPRMALFVGFTEDDAGPVRLCMRKAAGGTGSWTPVSVSEPRTVYRFSIPVSVPETPASPAAEADQ